MALRLLLVFWLGVGYVLGDSNPGNDVKPVCTAWCREGPVSQDKLCNHVNVSKIDDGVCGCSSNHRLSLSYSNFSATLLQFAHRRNFMKITWEQTVGLSTVLYLPGYDGDIGSCWNISTSVPVQMAGKRTVTLRVGCTQPDKLNIADPRFKVLDLREWVVVASYKNVTKGQILRSRHRGGGRQRKKRSTACDCWLADSVILSRLGSSDLMVQWIPFCSSSDIRVRVEKYSTKAAVRDFSMRLIDLCMKGISSTIIRNLTYGTYRAKVAAIGERCSECLPIRWIPSDPISIIDPKETTTPVIRQAPVRQEDDNLVRVAIVVVGVFAFVGVVSLGAAFCFCRKKKHKPYDIVNTSDGGTEPFLSSPVTIGEVRHGECAERITDLLSRQLSRSHKLVLRKNLEDISSEPDDGHHVLVMALDDVYGGHLFQRYKGFWESSIFVHLDYTTSGLAVRIPGDLDQLYFRGQPNNRVRRTEPVDIEEFLARVNPKLVLPNSDIDMLKTAASQLVSQEIDNTRRIFLISLPDSNDRASLELVKLMRHLGKHVTSVNDEEHHVGQEELGYEEWTRRQIRRTDMIVVVGSYIMYKLVQRFISQDPVPEYAIGAVTSLCVLNDNAEHAPVLFVSFSNQFKYIHKVMSILTRLQTAPRYDLSGTNTLNVTNALRVFLSRLVADQEVVNSACANANDFCRYVQDSETQLAEWDNVVDKTSSEADSRSGHTFGRFNQENDCLLWVRRKSVESASTGFSVSNVPGGVDV